MVLRRPAAQLVAAAQPCVEPFQQLGVQLGRRQRAERRTDVEADQALVALARRVFQLGHVEPLLDNLTHRDRAARVPLLVDLPQKPRQLDLGFLMGPCGLTEVPLLAGQRVHARVHDRSERAVRPVLDVPAGTAPATCHDGKHSPGPSQSHSQTER